MLPVFEPDIGEQEIQYVLKALRDGEISGSFGKFLPEFEEKFAAYCGCRYGVAVSSGTTALHLAVAAAGVQPGDEILMNASTNIATALAAYHHQAVTVPVDSEPDTWNLNLDLIESLISPKTKIILPVHIFGHPVDMDRVMKIAEKHSLTVIEDCAEAHGATVRGKKVGGIGHMGCFSFYANKILTTGEGGMVVTNDPALAEKLRLLRNLAFGKPRFLHQVPGYNFRMTGMQAALGLAQLGRIDTFVEEHRTLARWYNEHLAGIDDLQLPVEKEWAKNVYWMYSVVLKKTCRVKRDDLTAFLLKEGFETRTMFCPMSRQPFLVSQKGYRHVECPVADWLWESGFYLPSSNKVTESDVKKMASAIKGFLNAK